MDTFTPTPKVSSFQENSNGFNPNLGSNNMNSTTSVPPIIEHKDAQLENISAQSINEDLLTPSKNVYVVWLMALFLVLLVSGVLFYAYTINKERKAIEEPITVDLQRVDQGLQPENTQPALVETASSDVDGFATVSEEVKINDKEDLSNEQIDEIDAYVNTSADDSSLNESELDKSLE